MKFTAALAAVLWALTAPLVAGHVRHAALASPLLKVVSLIDELHSRISADVEAEEKVYRNFVAQCAQSVDKRQLEIRGLEATVESLQALSLKGGSEESQFNAQITELVDSLTADEAELKDAGASRETERADYEESNQEFLEVLETLQRATDVLQKELDKAGASVKSGAFLQRPSAGLRMFAEAIQEVVDGASVVASVEELARLSAMVQEGPAQSGEGESVSSSPGTIDAVMKALEDIKTKATRSQDELRTKEAAALHHFELLKASIEDRRKTKESVLQDLKKSVSQTKQDEAVAEKRMSQRSQDLEKLKQSLSALQHECMLRATVHSTDTKDRKAELEVLKAARDHIMKGVSGTAASSGRAASFLQLRSRRSHLSSADEVPAPTPAPGSSGASSAPAPRRRAPRAPALLQDGSTERVRAAERALGGLERMLRKTKSAALSQLASRLRATIRYARSGSGSQDGGPSDPFSKVKAIMEEMVQKLQAENTDEMDRKRFCDSELSKTMLSKQERQSSLEGLATKLEKATAELATDREEMKQLQEQLRDLASSHDEFVRMRHEEKANHESSAEFLRQGLTSVQRALRILDEFYGLSVGAEPLPEADATDKSTADFFVNAQKAGSSPGSAIIKILQAVDQDFAKNLADIQEEEDAAATYWSNFQQEQFMLRKSKELALRHAQEDANGLEKQAGELRQDRAAAEEELEAVEEYLTQLHVQCHAFMGAGDVDYERHQAQVEQEYKDKQAHRDIEEAAIREALQILSALNRKAERKGTDWQTAIQLGDSGASVVANIGKESFNALFAKCPVVRYLRNGAVHSVYIRTTPVKHVNAYNLFTFDWTNAGNVLNTDFEIYDSLEQAQLGQERWQFCSYGDTGAGYPGKCGKVGEVLNEWFALPGSTRAIQGITSGASLEIYAGSSCPSDVTA